VPRSNHDPENRKSRKNLGNQEKSRSIRKFVGMQDNPRKSKKLKKYKDFKTLM
jgi:hypothetical protein